MDYYSAKFWFDVAQFTLTSILGVYVWLVNRNRATRSAIDRVDSRVDDIKQQVARLEQDMHHAPGNSEIGEIHQRIDRVGQGVTRMEGEMKQVNKTLYLIQQYLLEGANK